MQISALQNLAQDKIAITGASSGIGEQLALQLAQQQASLILIARREERLKELQSTCQALTSQPVQIYPLDVSNAVGVKNIAARIQHEVGTVDVLINAAGFGDFTEFMATDYQLWKQMLHVNVLGTLLMTRYIAAPMIDQGCGQIINIGSMGGKIATPKSAVYSATKAAIIAFSNSLRLELQPLNVQVTTINPGPVQTNFFEIADHTGNYLKSVGKIILDPQQLAHKIIHCIGRPVRELNTPWIMELGYLGYQLFPRIGDFLTRTLGNQK